MRCYLKFRYNDGKRQQGEFIKNDKANKMSSTVSQLLKIPELAGIELIAGESGLERCVKSVNVILTFDPVWDKSMMSEEALLELNML